MYPVFLIGFSYFRFFVDLAVISLIESGAMETKDFIRTENYNLRLKPTGARKIVNEFSNILNKKVSYQGIVTRE